jgi:hypothetical protein
MSEPIMDNLVKRIERLERENRWWRRIESLMLVGLAGLVVMGQAQCNLRKTGANKDGNVVEATEFVVRDANGKPRAKLTDYSLVFTNPDGDELIRLSASDNASALTFGASGMPTVILSGCWPQKSPYICVGPTALTLSSTEGNAQLSAGGPVELKPSLSVSDKSGKVIWTAPR